MDPGGVGERERERGWESERARELVGKKRERV